MSETSRSIIHNTEEGSAPSARRTAISRCRCNHGQRHHTIESYAGYEQCEHAEESGERREESFLNEGIVDIAFEHAG
jgi:hypothetical protein